MPLILDTHVLIWLTERTQLLSPEVLAEIDRSSLEESVMVSPMTFWEVTMLNSRGKMDLTKPIDGWRRAVVETPGLSVAPITPEIAVESARLPGNFHADPADRFLVATARTLGAALVTRDRTIQRYAAEGHVRVLAA